MASPALGGGLHDLPRLRNHRRRRFSSFDRTGGNRDYIVLDPGETATLAEMTGPGCVKHVWVTMRTEMKWHLRKLVLRAYWDGEEHPSVEAPIGDFFGIGHGVAHNYVSAPLQMSPEDGRGFNCWWPMPYSYGARVTVENQGEGQVTAFYYYVDYEEWAEPEPGLGRFHAMWRRENPTDGVPDKGMLNREWMFAGENPRGEGNYLILEAEGRGHYVGCNVNFVNLRETEEFNWYGEGDDMIFIDGEETRKGHVVQIPHTGPSLLREKHTSHHRARPRQPPQRRRQQHRLLVPIGASQALHSGPGGPENPQEMSVWATS